MLSMQPVNAVKKHPKNPAGKALYNAPLQIVQQA
jgi:hypothetical protein